MTKPQSPHRLYRGQSSPSILEMSRYQIWSRRVEVLSNEARTVVVIHRTIVTRLSEPRHTSVASITTPEQFALLGNEIARRTARIRILRRAKTAVVTICLVAFLLLIADFIAHAVSVPPWLFLLSLAAYPLCAMLDSMDPATDRFTSFEDGAYALASDSHQNDELPDEILAALAFCSLDERDAVFELAETNPPADEALLEYLTAHWMRQQKADHDSREAAHREKVERIAGQKLIELGIET